MHQLIQADAHRCRMIGHIERSFFTMPFFSRAANLHEAGAVSLADAVDAAAGQLRLCGKIEQPVLEAGRTEVGDEDFHVHFLKKASSTPFSRRAMTCALTSSPTCLATCAPASTAARTEPTSPRTTVVTYAPPICT